MAKRGNKYKVGLLTVIGVGLLIISLLSLGVLKYFRPKIPIMTGTSESIQGLSVGAKVKVKGVIVGQVTGLKLGADGAYVYVYMDFDPTTFASKYIDSISITQITAEFIKSKIQENIDRGLRCQFQYEGITGSMFVEIGIFDIERYPVTKVPVPPDSPPYIPSIPPSSVGNILEETQLALSKIAQVDFEKISIQLEVLLGLTNNIMESGNIENNMEELNRTLKSLTALINYLETNPNSLITGKRSQSTIPAFSD